MGKLVTHATEEVRRMKLTRLGGGCWDGTCPTLYVSDRGTIVVQGWVVSDSDVTPPAGEALVEIPVELLEQLKP
jgi:hypothetical protein